jgi:16S rRNA (cytosine967-C5)-methyltransferase
MTPSARVAAAAGLLDQILAGAPAERTLTNWARASRFAGSKDRAAVRDLVYDALRRRRSLAWVGGTETGRGLMIGALRRAGTDPAELLTGEGHALPQLGPQDAPRDLRSAPPGVQLDMPDWLLAHLQASLGKDLEAACLALAGRGPVTLRANLLKGNRDDAQAALAEDGIEAARDPEVPTALQVRDGAGKVTVSRAFLQGLVELQDASSQAAVLRLPMQDGQRVLDFCAGGGGKTLAIGALAKVQLFAHDKDSRRMADLMVRAARAGLRVELLADPASEAPFDLVYVDAPCSGSGTWRRTPDAKWRLTPERLAAFAALQDDLLAQTADLVTAGGWLVFATCSILREEGEERVEAFLARRSGWVQEDWMRRHPSPSGDGFVQAIFRRQA